MSAEEPIAEVPLEGGEELVADVGEEVVVAEGGEETAAEGEEQAEPEPKPEPVAEAEAAPAEGDEPPADGEQPLAEGGEEFAEEAPIEEGEGEGELPLEEGGGEGELPLEEAGEYVEGQEQRGDEEALAEVGEFVGDMLGGFEEGGADQQQYDAGGEEQNQEEPLNAEEQMEAQEALVAEEFQAEEAIIEEAAQEAEAAADQMSSEERLTLETKAREELEDMILRIEKHYKAEQAARQKAEELLQQAIAAEMDAKNALEDIQRQRHQEQKQLDEERSAVKRERHALETMRQEFENELQAARSEVGKAQDALSGSEDRIRAAEQLERGRMEQEYQAKIATLSNDLHRTREETAMQTRMMQEEMAKWKMQAAVVGQSVMEAKNEVLQRKKELDMTRENMDRLIEKLMMGREMGIQLHGAIEGNQRAMAYMGSPMVTHPQGKVLPPMKPGQAVGSWMGEAPVHGRPKAKTANNSPARTQMPAAANSGSSRLPPISAPPNHHQPVIEPYSPIPLPPGYKGGAHGAEQFSHVQSKLHQSSATANTTAAAKKNAKPKAKPDRQAEAERESKRMAAMARMFN